LDAGAGASAVSSGYQVARPAWVRSRRGRSRPRLPTCRPTKPQAGVPPSIGARDRATIRRSIRAARPPHGHRRLNARLPILLTAVFQCSSIPPSCPSSLSHALPRLI
jgi:hypothetical protein